MLQMIIMLDPVRSSNVYHHYNYFWVLFNRSFFWRSLQVRLDSPKIPQRRIYGNFYGLDAISVTQQTLKGFKCLTEDIFI